MKIAFLASRFPYPLDKGDKVRTYHQLKYLSKTHQVHLFCISDKPVPPADLAHIQTFCAGLHIYRINKLGILFNLLLTLFSKLPFQTGYFYRSSIKRLLWKELNTLQPDAIICQLVRMTEYAKDYKHPNRLLDYMDVLSADMARRTNIATGLVKHIYNTEHNRLLRYEAELYTKFNKFTIISKQDRDLLPISNNSSVQIIPNGIDIEKAPNYTVTKQYDVLFFGNLGYLSNVESAIFLAEKVVPELLKTHPNLKVHIAGAEPNKRVLALQNNHITVSGWVDDKWACFAAAKVFVAPMLISVGMQNKILEAMAVNVPCVVTTMANNAIGAENGKEVLVADTNVTFAAAIAKLIDDSTFAKQLATNAHSLISTNYTWAQTVSRLEGYLSA